MPNEQFFSQLEQVTFNEMMMSALDQHAELEFFSASSLKQQSSDRHVAPLGHIIPIPSQPVFALTRTHDLPHSRRAR
jgi:hypothetical protein